VNNVEDIKQRWQAEQIPYPLDADYEGAKSGLFDPSEYAEKLIGKPTAGDTLLYLFRRFGCPKFGWDGLKHLIQYQITTPMAGVILVVEPAVAGGGTFGYMLREDIDQACEDEERKPHEDRQKRFEAWAMKEHGIEIIRIFDQDNNKLNRMWQVWGADKQDIDFEDQHAMHRAFFNDQEVIRVKYTQIYGEIAPYPAPTPLADRPDDSIMKQCHTALCAAIMDLLRPVAVRGVLLNILGFVGWNKLMTEVDIIEYAPCSGCGVGDELEVPSDE